MDATEGKNVGRVTGGDRCAALESVEPQLSGPRVLKMLHKRVRPREEQALVAGVLPAHTVGRAAVGVRDLDDLRVAVVFSNPVPLDDDAIAGACSHGVSFSAAVSGS